MNRRTLNPLRQFLLQLAHAGPNTKNSARRRRWCEFEGWLYFDLGHDEESENIAPGNPENWRATAWEVHPITKITVMK